MNATHIQFEVVKDNKGRAQLAKVAIKTGHASYTCNIKVGSVYKVRCRSVRSDLYSDWSEYSDSVSTKPAAPASITSCKATSETSVSLSWKASTSAETYDIEYTTKKRYFDGSNQVTQVNGIKTTSYEITGLES